MNRDEFMELVYETFADEPDNVLANGIIEAADAYVEYEKAQLSREDTTSGKPETHEERTETHACDLISRQAAIDALNHMCSEDENEITVSRANVNSMLKALPPAQPEPTRIIPETRAIPSDDDRVSLSERVTATYYDDEYEEWSQRTVTVRDVLDAVCDEYTVLPTIQPEQCGDKSYTLWKESYEELKRRMDELTSCSDIISRQAAIDGGGGT